jgi:hypothetical protein
MAVLHFSSRGMLAEGLTNVLLGEGPVGPIPQHIIPFHGPEETLQFGNVTVSRHAVGLRLALSDVTIEYFQQAPKKPTAHACNVLVLDPGVPAERLLKLIKPRLAILHSGSLERARELQKSTGIQTIAAGEHAVIDVRDYSALSSQQRLTEFTAAF